jgi:hypothetical protein
VATFVPAPKCVVVTVNGEQAGIPCQFGFGVRLPTEPILTDLDELVTLVGDWITDPFIGLLNGAAHVTSVKAQVQTTADGLVKDIELDETGTDITHALPSQVAVCVTKDTGYAGRSRRGRLYVWGVAEGNTSGVRTLSLAGMSAYNTVFATLLTSLAATDWVPVIISTIEAGVPRTTALITDVFQMVCRDARLDTQRRRLGRAI